MKQLEVVHFYNLNLGDRLVREKGFFSKHYGIYVGVQNGIPMVAENQISKGVQYVSLHEFLLGNINNLTRIQRFSGTEEKRDTIIPCINRLIGTSYDLVNFNCEHFVEIIINGKPKSKQVNNTALALAVLAVVGIASSSTNTK